MGIKDLHCFFQRCPAAVDAVRGVTGTVQNDVSAVAVRRASSLDAPSSSVVKGRFVLVPKRADYTCSAFHLFFSLQESRHDVV
ncbi:MAG: hypothetical protein L0J67_05340 [Halomonas sp.]|nr:hypothetical protein [Halomonas sp.]MDN6336059.1 hypothetical protein [Halomonas sp.]